MFEALLRSRISQKSSLYKIIKKCSKMTNILAVIFLTWEMIRLIRRFVEEIQKQLTITYIGFVMRIIDFALWLIISSRRLLIQNDESETLNKLFATSAPSKYVDVGFVLMTGLFVVFLERGLSVQELVSGDSYIYTCNLIFLIRLGFECSMVTILATQKQLYKHLNEFARHPINNSTNLLAFRTKFQELHSSRVVINDLYNCDLFLYFVSSQIIMLLECLDSMKALIRSENFNVVHVLMPSLRFVRVFSVMSYVIWKWQMVSDESSRILIYLFEQNMEKLSSSIYNQVEGLIDSVQVRNRIFSANKYYDINMNLLYNISGTVFAYFFLILTVAVNQIKSNH